jgi:hypothetical protein
MGMLLSGLLLSIHRVFHLKLESALSQVIVLFALLFFVVHVSYLSFFRFDYSYNIIAGVFVGAGQNLIWLAWYGVNSNRKYAWKICTVVIVMFACKFLLYRLLFFQTF